MNATNRIVLCTAAMFSLMAAASAPPTSAPAGAYRVQETLLAPMDATVMSPVFSRDGSRLAYITRKGQKFCVVVDAQAGAEYDQISGLSFSPDCKHVAYTARHGQKSSEMLDGQAGPEYDAISKLGLIFSPDSKRAAYVARNNQKWFAVVDGQAG